MQNPVYRGRFAPSPTGPLHFGSIVAAMGSYLQAKSQGGEWLVRIDDIDPPREIPGIADNILFTLEQLGFEWDGNILFQSENSRLYQEVVDSLLANKQAYFCRCSRKMIQQANQDQENKTRYPGTCRELGLSPPAHSESPDPYSVRVITNENTISFDDAIQGQQEVNLEKTSGDFVIQRRDGFFSYHLASGFDDAEQGITEVVRGSDLLDSTACQLHIQKQLKLSTPRYCHLPVALNSEGQKLSKQSYAAAVKLEMPVKLLCNTLKFLGHLPPKNLESGSISEFWEWAINNWEINNVGKHAKEISDE